MEDKSISNSFIDGDKQSAPVSLRPRGDLHVKKNEDFLNKNWISLVKNVTKKYENDPYSLAAEISKIKSLYSERASEMNK